MRRKLFLTLLCSFFCYAVTPSTASGQTVAKPKTTVIYLVRHAEKVTTDPDEKDPELTPAGYARAQNLQNYFQNIAVDVFFTTPYKRTRLTLEPLASGRELLPYKAHSNAALRDVILKEHAGKTIVVAGHSNTLLEIIEAFGVKRPVPVIADTKYDYIFKVMLRPGKKAKVETATYGTSTK